MMPILLTFVLASSHVTANAQSSLQTPDESPDCSSTADTATAPAEGGALVVTPDPYASDIACRILLEGGTAADAVAAAQFTLGLTEPQSSGPGGGAVGVYYDADSGETDTWNASVPAPEDDDGTTETGVPQTPGLMTTMQGRYGELDLDDVLSPVADLAEAGFEVGSRTVRALERRHEDMETMPWPEVSLDDLPTAGDEVTNPSYAGYLRDLEPGASLEVEDALCTDYRDHEVCGSGSTGTGMMMVGEALGIIDNLTLGDDPQHVVTEAQRMAIANGNTWMQDPDVDPSLSEAYLDNLVTDADHHEKKADLIDPDSSFDNVTPDTLPGHSATYAPNNEEGTTQITVRDSDGSMASVTSTLHQHFGTGDTRDGYFLNNSLNNFSTSPDDRNTNVRAAGVRPKTAMSPVIVLRDGEPVLALGSPGGGSIPSFVIKTIVGVIDEGMTARDAVDAPNYGATGRNETYVEGSDRWTVSALSVIWIDGNNAYAEADTRAGGAATSVE